MRNRIYITTIAFILYSIAVNAQWRAESCDTRHNLNSIYLNSQNSGWIVGDSGTILKKSVNGWEQINRPTNEDLYAVFMIDGYNGWATGANGTILHYNGSMWETYKSPTRNDLLAISFRDKSNGIATGRHGTILVYKDGVWNQTPRMVRGDLLSVSAINSTVWTGGELECVGIPIIKIKETKGEMTVKTFDSYASIYSIAFPKETSGYAVGSPSTLLHFDGYFWNKITTDYNFPSLKSVYFRDDTGITVGCEGTILIYSENIWKKENSITDHNLNGAFMIDNVFYAIGDYGTILVNHSAGADNLNILPEITSDFQVYPNPCNDFINISVTGNRNESLKLSVTNATGQIIKNKIVNLNIGDNIFKFTTGDLKEGLYFLSACAGDNNTSFRFIVKH